MFEEKGSVLYVGGFELPDKNAAAHRVTNNAKILRELGYRVIFCGVDREKEIDTVEYVSGFESSPVKYPASTKQWIRYMFDAKKYIRILNENKDIKLVVCYNLLAVPLAKLLSYCKKRHIKVVADCTEWYANDFSLNPIKFIKFLNTSLCMKWFQKKCDGMIAISSFLKNYYEKHIENIILLPPLVDIEDEKFHLETSKNNEAVSLVYAGSPALRKEALGDVVKILNNFKDFNYKFTVVGITRDWFCSVYGIEPDDTKIEFTGRISHNEALIAVSKSDYSIIIRPNTRITVAGFPTKFVEAISCGTAVIANDTSDLSSYLKDGKNGYLVSLDNLKNDLEMIFSQKDKPIVEKRLFDYRSWKDKFNVFLNDLGL